MGSSIPFEIRKKIVKDRQSGLTYGAIVQKRGYSVSGVKKIWRRYLSAGESGLETDYHRCGRKPVYDAPMQELIHEHRNGEQGAPFIRSVLEEKYPDRRIPHERTIQRLWQAAGTNRPKGRRSAGKSGWTREAQDTWQIDGKEQIELSNAEQVSWLNIVDEASRSQLQTEVFPPEQDYSSKYESSHRESE